MLSSGASTELSLLRSKAGAIPKTKSTAKGQSQTLESPFKLADKPEEDNLNTKEPADEQKRKILVCKKV